MSFLLSYCFSFSFVAVLIPIAFHLCSPLASIIHNCICIFEVYSNYPTLQPRFLFWAGQNLHIIPRELTKKSKLPVSGPLFWSTSNVNRVYSGPRPIINPSLVGICSRVFVFLCYPADKPVLCWLKSPQSWRIQVSTSYWTLTGFQTSYIWNHIVLKWDFRSLQTKVCVTIILHSEL